MRWKQHNQKRNRTSANARTKQKHRGMRKHRQNTRKHTSNAGVCVCAFNHNVTTSNCEGKTTKISQDRNKNKNTKQVQAQRRKTETNTSAIVGCVCVCALNHSVTLSNFEPVIVALELHRWRNSEKQENNYKWNACYKHKHRIMHNKSKTDKNTTKNKETCKHKILEISTST